MSSSPNKTWSRSSWADSQVRRKTSVLLMASSTTSALNNLTTSPLLRLTQFERATSRSLGPKREKCTISTQTSRLAPFLWSYTRIWNLPFEICEYREHLNLWWVTYSYCRLFIKCSILTLQLDCQSFYFSIFGMKYIYMASRWSNFLVTTIYFL